VFLYTDGIYSLNAGIKSPGDRNLAEELDAIGARGIPVVGCGVCCKFRGVTKAHTIEHGKLGGLGALDGYIDQADRFVTFGG
jgi:sulfur relay (sulfurtransferase) complex TusBCD TusD component (DsrE family)